MKTDFHEEKEIQKLLWAGEGDVLKGKVALAAAREASLLSSIPAPIHQLPKWKSGYDWDMALWWGNAWPFGLKGVSQPPSVQPPTPPTSRGWLGEKLSLIKPSSPTGSPAHQSIPDEPPKFCCQNSASVHWCQRET